MEDPENEFKPYVEHPLEHCRVEQYNSLRALAPSERRTMYLLYCYGNAVYRYGLLTKDYSPTNDDFEFWLSGLTDELRSKFRADGIDNHLNTIEFKRSLLERRDIGLDDYIKQLMKPEDYEEFKLI